MYSTTDLFPCLIAFSASRAACVLSRGANCLLNAISKSAYVGKGSPPARIVSRYGRAQLQVGPFMRFMAAFIHLRSSARHPADWAATAGGPIWAATAGSHSFMDPPVEDAQLTKAAKKWRASVLPCVPSHSVGF